MNQVPFNPEPDGTSRTIKANYWKVSRANFIRGGVRSHSRCGCFRYGRASRTDKSMTPKVYPHVSVLGAIQVYHQKL